MRLIDYDRGYDAGRKAVLDEILLKITHLRNKVYLNAQDQIIVEVLTIINNKISQLSVHDLYSVNSQEPYDFAKWVATEIFDDNWEYNKDAFAEIACRKLAKLGIVRAKGDEWELVKPQESEDNG